MEMDEHGMFRHGVDWVYRKNGCIVDRCDANAAKEG